MKKGHYDCQCGQNDHTKKPERAVEPNTAVNETNCMANSGVYSSQEKLEDHSRSVDLAISDWTNPAIAINGNYSNITIRWNDAEHFFLWIPLELW